MDIYTHIYIIMIYLCMYVSNICDIYVHNHIYMYITTIKEIKEVMNLRESKGVQGRTGGRKGKGNNDSIIF